LGRFARLRNDELIVTIRLSARVLAHLSITSEVIMAPYDPRLIDVATCDSLLQILVPYRSFDVLFMILDDVALRLIKTAYPITITFPWYTGVPAPPDADEHLHEYIPARSFMRWFWPRLYTDIDYGPPQQRWTDGTLVPDDALITSIIAQLTVFPFEMAIHTWFAVCVAWLQVCNADVFLAEDKKGRKPVTTTQEIPYHMAGMVELVHF
jgi:hypothetical protein